MDVHGQQPWRPRLSVIAPSRAFPSVDAGRHCTVVRSSQAQCLSYGNVRGRPCARLVLSRTAWYCRRNHAACTFYSNKARLLRKTTRLHVNSFNYCECRHRNQRARLQRIRAWSSVSVRWPTAMRVPTTVHVCIVSSAELMLVLVLLTTWRCCIYLGKLENNRNFIYSTESALLGSQNYHAKRYLVQQNSV